MLKHAFHFLLAVMTGVCLAQAPEPSTARLTPTVLAVKKAKTCVVNIGTERVVRTNDGFETLFNEFFGRYQFERPTLKKEYFPLGSGILVDSQGLIVTNYHVVSRAQTIEVRLWNGVATTAEVIGFDQPNDLCLLQITDAPIDTGLDAADFALPDDVLLGETVISVGNPFGLEHSVTQGVLSAINRSMVDQDLVYDDILQIDAAINPGNSGGPLINLDGNLIGVNLAVRKGAEGIGFALPVKRIEQFLSHWLRPEHFGNIAMGISTNEPFSSGHDGVVVPELLADGPAAKAGLKAGDVITQVNGVRVGRLIEFGREIWHRRNGDTMTFTLQDGRTVRITLEPMPPEQLVKTRLGLNVQKLTNNLREALGLPNEVTGLAISEVLPQEEFNRQQAVWREVLKRGDIIMRVNDRNITEIAELSRLLEQSRSGQKLNMTVLSQQQRMNRLVPLAIDVFLN